MRLGARGKRTERALITMFGRRAAMSAQWQTRSVVEMLATEVYFCSHCLLEQQCHFPKHGNVG
jgi:hypothetical protein